ncbi:MAG TPA: hypothetical protein VFH89_04780 [Sphingomicrobium sp.]|nr:hypothetical protein [Sphingomicrobium sp.]
MLLRSFAFVAVALTLLVAVVHARDDRHPLLIDAGSTVIEQPDGPPIAIPDPYARFAPCPVTPQNFPMPQERTT